MKVSFSGYLSYTSPQERVFGSNVSVFRDVCIFSGCNHLEIADSVFTKIASAAYLFRRKIIT